MLNRFDKMAWLCTNQLYKSFKIVPKCTKYVPKLYQNCTKIVPKLYQNCIKIVTNN